MAFEIQESALSSNVGAEYSNEDNKVHITLISSSALKNKVHSLQLKIPIFRTFLTRECCCEGLVETLLGCMSDIPSTFLNGHDCDMVEKLSRMLRDSMERRHGVNDIDNLCVFITVSKDSCHYNVVNFSDFYHAGQELPSYEFVQSLACESGVYSLPAGASAIERLKAQNDTVDCAICMQGFLNDSEIAKLPCSHVYHCDCILEWFVQKGTCPLCRFPCSHP